MKWFFAALLVLLGNANATSSPEVDFPEPGKMVLNLAQWQQVAHEENYTMYMDRASVDAHSAAVELLSVVVFDDGKDWKYYLAPVPVKYIMAHGNLLCEYEKFVITTLWYIDSDNNVILIEKYRFGEFGSEMGTAGTARNAMLLMACRPSS